MAVSGDELDAEAVGLTDRYTRADIPSVLIRVTEAGNVRFIGPKLPKATMVSLLLSAAECYAEQVTDDKAAN